jgi:hypothetical protein
MELPGWLKAFCHWGIAWRPFIILPSNPLVEEVMSRRTIHALSMMILGPRMEYQRGWVKSEEGRQCTSCCYAKSD